VRFTKAAHAGFTLDPKYVVHCIGTCQLPNCLALITEHMAGGTLRNFLKSNPDLSWSKKRRMALEITEGLTYLHSQYTLHGNFTSLSVFVDGKGHCKIANFGLSITTTEALLKELDGPIGTHSFIAPEQLRLSGSGEPVIYSEKCDLFSLGMVLWELATQQVPFANYCRSITTLLTTHSGLRESLPSQINAVYEDLIRRCWDQEPNKRPTLKEISETLLNSRTVQEGCCFWNSSNSAKRTVSQRALLQKKR